MVGGVNMQKAEKIDGVYYFKKSKEQILVEELIEKLEEKGLIKKADIDDVKAKTQAKINAGRNKRSDVQG